MRFLCRSRVVREDIKNISESFRDDTEVEQPQTARAGTGTSEGSKNSPAQFYFHVLPQRQEKIGTGGEQIMSNTLRTTSETSTAQVTKGQQGKVLSPQLPH